MLKKIIFYITLLFLGLLACEASRNNPNDPGNKNNTLSSEARLNNLNFSKGTLTPSFDPNTYSYTLNLDENSSTLMVFSTTEHYKAKATLTIQGNPYQFSESISLTESENEIIINVLAENKKNSNSYRITAYLPSASGTKLSNLTFSNGNLYPDFSSEVYTYNLLLDYGVSSLSMTPQSETSLEITLNGNFINSTENMILLPGDNNIAIKLIDQNNSNIATYTINAYQPLTSNSYIELSDLFVTGGKLSSSFSPDIENYDIQLDYEVNSITIAPVARDPRATVSATIKGTSIHLEDPISLDIGNNEIIITVQAFDSQLNKNYMISVYYTTAKLSYLSFSNATLNPTFSAETYTYNLILDEGINAITPILNKQDPNSSVVITNKGNPINMENPISLDLGENNIIITVNAPESYDVKNYSINAYKSSRKLAALTFSIDGTLEPSFEPDTKQYVFSLEETVSNIIITPTPEDPKATVQTIFKGNYIDLNDSVDFDIGDNNFTIEVSNENSFQINEYLLNIKNPAKLFDANSLKTYIGSPNPGENHYFGSSLDISENTIVAGSSEEENRKGAVYIFTKETDEWTQKARLEAPNSDNDDFFGSAVAISQETIVIGASGESSNYSGVLNGPSSGGFDDGSHDSSGAAYVFVKNGLEWEQQAYLKASNPDPNSFFGMAVDIDKDTIVVGALWENYSSQGLYNGEGYLGYRDGGHDSSGSAYVFVRNGSTWSQQAYLKSSNSDAGDNFGRSVAIWGNTIVVGAPAEDSAGSKDDNSSPQSGAVYVFTREGNNWSEQAYLKAENIYSGIHFGMAADIDNNMIAVGAPYENSTFARSGKVYIFTYNETNWSQSTTSKAPNPNVDDFFGVSVDLKKGCLLVGATGEDSNATGIGGNQLDDSYSISGAAYLFFRENDNTWNFDNYLKATNTEAGDMFGSNLAISNSYTLIVSAPRKTENSGAIYIYE